jgi:hypothetical protein
MLMAEFVTAVKYQLPIKIVFTNLSAKLFPLLRAAQKLTLEVR